MIVEVGIDSPSGVASGKEYADSKRDDGTTIGSKHHWLCRRSD
jgi:hypothetical protein